VIVGADTQDDAANGVDVIYRLNACNALWQDGIPDWISSQC